MPSTNIFTLWLGKQTAKGSAAAAPVWGTNVRSSDIGPQATRGRIEETGLGRDVGDYETTLLSFGGNFECYFRPKIGGYIMWGVLGAKAVTGSGPYTHTFTPANDQPYFTVWTDWGNAKYEKAVDVKLTALTWTAQNGQSIRSQVGLQGLQFERVASIPVGGTLDDSEIVRYPGAVITTGGSANAAVQEYTLTINANQNTQQTTSIYNSYLEPGTRTIGLNQTEVYESLALYNNIYYGGAAGTTPSQTVFTRTWNATHVDSAGVQRVEIDVPEHALETAPLPPSTAAEIARYQATGGAQRPSSGDIITVDIVNSVATY